MACHAYLPGFVFHPELGMCRVSKDCQPVWPSPGARQEMVRSGTHTLGPHQCKEPWKTMSGPLEHNQLIKIDPTVRMPVLINIQDTHPVPVLFSLGIAEHCTRHEKILQFLMSSSRDVEKSGLDASLLSDLMGSQALTIDMHFQSFASTDHGCSYQEPNAKPSLIYPPNIFYARKSVLDFVGDLAYGTKTKFHSDGQVLFTGTVGEMKDLLLIVAQLYFKNSTKWRKQPLLVPHFDRFDSNEELGNIHGSSLKLEAVKIAPLKSPQKIKLKPAPKKKSTRRVGRERDLYRENYFHACESLLSLMMNRRQQGKMAFISLKKSGPELSHFLTQFSAGIAGTGLAVIFSIFCKVACRRVPFCASRLLNTGFGFGLLWLSGAVNRLRKTIVCISKNSSKMSLKEEEMMRRVDRSLNEIFFRAAALMAVVVLRLA